MEVDERAGSLEAIRVRICICLVLGADLAGVGVDERRPVLGYRESLTLLAVSLTFDSVTRCLLDPGSGR